MSYSSWFAQIKIFWLWLDQGTKIAFEEHCKRHKHSITPAGKVKIPDSQVAVLHQEPDWFRRGVAESIYIMQEEPTLNRDKGRHTLPEIFRELLTRDLTVTANRNIATEDASPPEEAAENGPKISDSN